MRPQAELERLRGWHAKLAGVSPEYYNNSINAICLIATTSRGNILFHNVILFPFGAKGVSYAVVGSVSRQLARESAWPLLS